ncbi:hypothetical protein LSAT2_033072 [Lamellibrachia satsuma]|nr:hypothetical protein LSAT2_033072 [Lamellibrachia satsuma]
MSRSSSAEVAALSDQETVLDARTEGTEERETEDIAELASVREQNSEERTTDEPSPAIEELITTVEWQMEGGCWSKKRSEDEFEVYEPIDIDIALGASASALGFGLPRRPTDTRDGDSVRGDSSWTNKEGTEQEARPSYTSPKPKTDENTEEELLPETEETIKPVEWQEEGVCLTENKGDEEDTADEIEDDSLIGTGGDETHNPVGFLSTDDRKESAVDQDEARDDIHGEVYMDSPTDEENGNGIPPDDMTQEQATDENAEGDQSPATEDRIKPVEWQEEGVYLTENKGDEEDTADEIEDDSLIDTGGDETHNPVGFLSTDDRKESAVDQDEARDDIHGEVYMDSPTDEENGNRIPPDDMTQEQTTDENAEGDQSPATEDRVLYDYLLFSKHTTFYPIQNR